MSTGNFHNINASKIFAFEAEDQFLFDMEIENIEDTLEAQGFSLITLRDPEELRSYPSRVLGYKEAVKSYLGLDFSVEIWAVVRSGYYSGANLDYFFRFGGVSDWYDENEAEYYAYDFENHSDTSEAQALRFSKYVETWANKASEKLSDEIESIYSDLTIPLIVSARFSNGETWYERADNNKAKLKNALLSA